MLGMMKKEGRREKKESEKERGKKKGKGRDVKLGEERERLGKKMKKKYLLGRRKIIKNFLSFLIDVPPSLLLSLKDSQSLSFFLFQNLSFSLSFLFILYSFPLNSPSLSLWFRYYISSSLSPLLFMSQVFLMISGESKIFSLFSFDTFFLFYTFSLFLFYTFFFFFILPLCLSLLFPSCYHFLPFDSIRDTDCSTRDIISNCCNEWGDRFFSRGKDRERGRNRVNFKHCWFFTRISCGISRIFCLNENFLAESINFCKWWLLERSLISTFSDQLILIDFFLEFQFAQF